MRSRTRRRSTSSRCSPGPRPPMPPPSRDSPSSRCARRGSRYFSCASSTCSLPSRERARWAKMSRISCVRSITRSSSRSAMLRACAGERSWSKITRSASCWKARTTRSSRRPEPTTVRGSICGRTCTSTSAISTPAERASSRSSATASSVSWRGRPALTATRIARSPRADRARARACAPALPRARRSSPRSRGRAAPADAAACARPRCRRASPDAGGRRALRSAGRSRPMPSVTIASRRSLARSVRSSWVSGSSPRKVWTQRRPRRRPWPARRRPHSGISIAEVDADHGVRDGAASIDEDAHLAADLVRDLGQLAREFLGDEATCGKPAPVEALEGSNLAGLQALGVAEDLDAAVSSGAERSPRPPASSARGPRGSQLDVARSAPSQRTRCQGVHAWLHIPDRGLTCRVPPGGPQARRQSQRRIVFSFDRPGTDRTDGTAMKANERALAVVILAAGQGKRMKSGLVKVLHELCGRPMLAYPIDVAEALAPERLVVVVGRDSERVCEAFSGRATFVEQTERRGTGHAVMQHARRARRLLRRRADPLRRHAAAARRDDRAHARREDRARRRPADPLGARAAAGPHRARRARAGSRASSR